MDGPFQANKTVTKAFEFNSKDVPIGKGFEVAFVSRENSTQTEHAIKGVNGPSSAPETIEFSLGALTKFTINVQVKNNEAIDTYGAISVKMDDPDISKFSSVDLPANKTVTKAFAFNSKDVSVGKDFEVNLIYSGIEEQEKYGINNPTEKPEIVEFVIPIPKR